LDFHKSVYIRWIHWYKALYMPKPDTLFIRLVKLNKGFAFIQTFTVRQLQAFTQSFLFIFASKPQPRVLYTKVFI